MRRAALAAELERQGERLPLISVVMPIYRPDMDLLAAAIASVRDQIGTRWELCLCDDGSNAPDVRAFLDEIATQDARIRVTALDRNGGISRATNAAADLATGDFLLFLDQDDLLAPDCLAAFALALGQDPAIGLAYSDSDKIDRDGRRHSPAFKPGWSPTLLLSHMYLGHAMVIRRALFLELGGMRTPFDGSQDYDLALRASERAHRVAHLPRMLYHWRVLPGSTALSAAEKPHSILAGQRAVNEALARRGVRATAAQPAWAERASIGLFAPQFAPQDPPPGVILYCDSGAEADLSWLATIVRSLPTATKMVWAGPPIAQLPPDVADRMDLLDRSMAERGALGRRLDHALALFRGRPVVLLHNAATPAHPGWLEQLAGYATLPTVGIAAARVIGPDDCVHNAGFVRPRTTAAMEPAFATLPAHRHGKMYLARVARECLAAPATCVAINASVLSSLPPIPVEVASGADLGVWLSEQARINGMDTVCCGDVDVKIGASAAGQTPTLAGDDDRWYNPNLGAQEAQFQPMRHAPALEASPPLRVVAVSHNLDREGAQTLLADLLCALKDAGLADPAVISPRHGELCERLNAAGIPIALVEAPRRRASVEQFNGFVAQLADAYRSLGADVVLANTLDMHPAVDAADRAGLGAVWWQHEGGPWHSYFRKLRVRMRARAFAAFAQAYRVVQVADATRRRWLPMATRNNFELIRHGIPDVRIAQGLSRWLRDDARARLGLDNATCCIVLMGSISARKGQADIVRAVATLPDDCNGRLRIKIVGAIVEPKYGAVMESELARLPPERRAMVDLEGPVNDPALYYAAADALVCCSRQESAPLAIVEAMSFGLPVLSTPVDGIPELVQFGRNALAYDPGDIPALAALVAQLVAFPDRRASLGKASRELAAQANAFDTMVVRFAARLGEAASLRRTPPRTMTE